MGDLLELKKSHPCGSRQWQVLRVGMDFRLKCLGCGHELMLPRAKAEKSRLAPVWSVGLSLGLLALFVVCSSFLIKQTYNPFIYFQF